MRAAATRFGDKTSVTAATKTLSFAELDALADRVAELLERGVRPGPPVSLYSQNRCEWIATYHGALQAGVVVVRAGQGPRVAVSVLITAIVDAHSGGRRGGAGTACSRLVGLGHRVTSRA
ncbi:AMP-binding protein [Amycolatopsis sp. PS_44_ISF1]|uniref:AMP-binding protein n=1 Tax=Amycolatopsis sp. PS_44_ISF1 TaxID=2974917 RepID=UPI0028DD55DB|nr:AMP-binding protein [Amycolatopsis sp. PS_44_ISF1]MDT8912234.1 long-chain fatty acid--CoA ligase [Amycolatopsis sp. PS_44_ISF1]